ncbi:MAG: hypothetical protein HW380_766 [Magnetococcales bacterium]|nr:hypothetical protein [Magnetococcales bacterium]
MVDNLCNRSVPPFSFKVETIAGVRGGSSPPAEVWRRSLQGFVFEFKQKASLSMGVWGRSPQGFGSCLKGIMNIIP